jgi:hypothetical protein
VPCNILCLDEVRGGKEAFERILAELLQLCGSVMMAWGYGRTRRGGAFAVRWLVAGGEVRSGKETACSRWCSSS